MRLTDDEFFESHLKKLNEFPSVEFTLSNIENALERLGVDSVLAKQNKESDEIDFSCGVVYYDPTRIMKFVPFKNPQDEAD